MLMMSPGSSTTQMVVVSRPASRQIVAELLLGEVEAAVAEAHRLLDLDERVGQGQGFLGGELEQVEGQALGGLGPDAGQLAQLVDELLDGGAEHAAARRAQAGGRAR